MSRAYINGVEVKIYDYQDGYCKCYIPELDITDWFNENVIEVGYAED